MFAYCLNNAVNRTDLAGYVGIWTYLFFYSDWGFVHRAVQKHIQQEFGVEIEVSLSFYGRADIVDGNGAVWEIKHAGKNPVARAIEAEAQAWVYIIFNSEITHLGDSGAFSGSFHVLCGNHSFLVSYETVSPGAVLYSVIEDPNYSGEYFFILRKAEKNKENTMLKPVAFGIPLNERPNFMDFAIGLGFVIALGMACRQQSMVNFDQ